MGGAEVATLRPAEELERWDPISADTQGPHNITTHTTMQQHWHAHILDALCLCHSVQLPVVPKHVGQRNGCRTHLGVLAYAGEHRVWAGAPCPSCLQCPAQLHGWCCAAHQFHCHCHHCLVPHQLQKGSLTPAAMHKHTHEVDEECCMQPVAGQPLSEGVARSAVQCSAVLRCAALCCVMLCCADHVTVYWQAAQG